MKTENKPAVRVRIMKIDPVVTGSWFGLLGRELTLNINYVYSQNIEA